MRNRRRVLTNVFYVIVLHCAVLDVARGLCLIVYGMPYFANSFYNINLSISTKVTLFRASTFALVALRICNMLTIFNLLIFTANEFIVIRYPLHYRRYIRRKVVIAALSCCWMISIIMGLGLLVPPSSPYLRSSEEKPWHIDIATLSMLMISILCFLVLAVVLVCYAFILRTIRRFQEENGTLSKNNRYRIHRDSKKVQNDSNSRRWRMQAMNRHKYIYVIGTVLIVDLLFLFPYSGIQLVAFLHINHFIEISQSSTLIRWWLQVFIGVHSVCQPLCYFRMTELRNLACCTSCFPWATLSRSLSQINRSCGNIRSALRDDDQLEPPQSPLISDPLLTAEHLSRTTEVSLSSVQGRSCKTASIRTVKSDNEGESIRPHPLRSVTKTECSSNAGQSHKLHGSWIRGMESNARSAGLRIVDVKAGGSR